MPSAKNEKYWPYTVMFLDHHKISQNLERQLSDGQKVGAVYHALLSNLPRFDASLIAIFGSKMSAVDDKDQDNEKLLAAQTTERNQRKVASSKLLLANGYYRLAAKVEADCGWQAIINTMSINQYWFLLNVSTVDVHEHLFRATEIYDLISYFDEQYLFMPLGFLNVGTSEYATQLV